MPSHEFTNYAFSDYLPMPIAADPGGQIAQSSSQQYHVVALETPVQHSPPAYWNPGAPYPGPPANQVVYVDFSSRDWWGRSGQGQLVWSRQVEFGELPPAIPQDMVQHIDTFQRFWGGYPSLARNRPAAFGDQVPVLNPSLGY